MDLAFKLPRPRPDCEGFIEILAGHARTRRVPLVEYLVDDVVMRPIVTDLLGRTWIDPGKQGKQGHLENFVQFWYRMGYDFVRYEESLPLPHNERAIPDAAPNVSRDRVWPDEHHGAITSWKEFEEYPWPNVEEFDFSAFEYVNAHLPEGMGLISSHGGGVYEQLSWIMSFEGLCNALYEDPSLVKAVADRLGELMTAFYRHLLSLDRLVALFPGDDMGYKSATMISPEALRTYTLPWHKRFAAMAHKQGIPYYLHSCGKVMSIMGDLIDEILIDGKHSFEDEIMPVEEFQLQYGDRIAVLGGLDINILSGGTADQVRSHVRFLLETCGTRGRYAMGSGNSVPSYVPVENYLAMIDESHRFNESIR
jgi:uroporphyrinogen decarboxylase